MSQLVIAEIFGLIKESDSEEAHVSKGWALIMEENLNQQNSIEELKMRSINSLDSKTFSNGSISIPESRYSTSQTKVLV